MQKIKGCHRISFVAGIVSIFHDMYYNGIQVLFCGSPFYKVGLRMKKRRLFLLLLSVQLLLTGCGSVAETMSDYASDASASKEAYSQGNYDMAEGVSAEETSASSAEDGSLPVTENRTDLGIDREMLVYTCNISIDTLDFEKSVEDFKDSLDQAGGFVESESYDDGYYGGEYVVDEELKDRTYTATVRIPADKYSSFLDGANKLGDVRSKSATVENVSQEYSDLGTSLEIYEAKEERYINLLSTITDDEYAVEVERELTELQIQIAQIKTRMSKIETDVAYSYINVTIHAVKEYEQAPARTDTFGQRLVNQLHNTWDGFLVFLEGTLFVFIGAFPYLIIAACILLIIFKIRKKKKQKTTNIDKNITEKAEEK